MGLWNRISRRVRYEWNKRLGGRPTMVYGFRDGKGPFRPSVRVSTSTYIGDRHGLQVEDHVFIGHFNNLDASNGIHIAEGCQITNYVSILTHSSHQAIRLYGAAYGRVKDKLAYNRGLVSIGAYTFIGPHTVIMPGTTIGKGCLVGAFSLLKGNYPDFAIIKGQPAEVVGDVREGDAAFLEDHPELRSHYEDWKSKKVKRLLLVGTNSVHTYNYEELARPYFDEVLLITDQPNDKYDVPREIVQLQLRNPFALLRSIFRIRSIVRQFRPSVVHIHQAGANAFIALLALSGMTSPPTIVTAWGSEVLYFPQRQRLYRLMVQFVLKKADFLTSDSIHMGNEMRKLTNKQLDISVINFGINIEFPDLPRENLMYTNRLHKSIYRVDKIITAFAQFRATRPDEGWKLVIAATGPLTDGLKKQVADLGIAGHVSFAGWVNKEDNSAYYARAKVFLSIPETDATAVSLLEAMAAGCIPVVSDLPANREWVEHGKKRADRSQPGRSIFRSTGSIGSRKSPRTECQDHRRKRHPKRKSAVVFWVV